MTTFSAGERLRERRVALGYQKRADFLRHLADRLGDRAPGDRLVGMLERDEKSQYGPDTVRAVDLWYELPAGTYAAWARGEDVTPDGAAIATRRGEETLARSPLSEPSPTVHRTGEPHVVRVYVKALGLELSATYTDAEDRVRALDDIGRALSAISESSGGTNADPDERGL